MGNRMPVHSPGQAQPEPKKPRAFHYTALGPY